MTAPAKPAPRVCGAPLAYRDMGDIGARRTCGNPAVTPPGLCKRHDPETKPKRDARGRILPTPRVVDPFAPDHDGACGCAECEEASLREVRQMVEPAPRVVAECCWTCERPVNDSDAPLRANVTEPLRLGRQDSIRAAHHRALGHDVRPVREEVKP